MPPSFQQEGPPELRENVDHRPAQVHQVMQMSGRPTGATPTPPEINVGHHQKQMLATAPKTVWQRTGPEGTAQCLQVACGTAPPASLHCACVCV